MTDSTRDGSGEVDELITRLHKWTLDYSVDVAIPPIVELTDRAAAALERLRAENARLQRMLDVNELACELNENALSNAEAAEARAAAADTLVGGLCRRLHQMIGAHSDDWRYWDNAAKQALRWVDATYQRQKEET